MRYTVLATMAVATFALGTQVEARHTKDYVPAHSSHYDSPFLDAMRNEEGRVKYTPIDQSRVVWKVTNTPRAYARPHVLDEFMDDTSRGPMEAIHPNAQRVMPKPYN